MNIYILGHKGFIGSSVNRFLSENNNVYGIGSKTKIQDPCCDIIVNCAGNSSKRLADLDIEKAYSYESKIIEKLKKLRKLCNRIIHISSICSKEKSHYGIIKFAVENHIKLIFDNYVILRPSKLIGPGLKKNPVFDLLNGNKLFVAKESVYNFMSTKDVAKMVSLFLNIQFKDIEIDIGASESIEMSRLAYIMKRENVVYGDKKEVFHVDISDMIKFFCPKTSEEYILEFINNLNKV